MLTTFSFLISFDIGLSLTQVVYGEDIAILAGDALLSESKEDECLSVYKTACKSWAAIDMRLVIALRECESASPTDARQHLRSAIDEFLFDSAEFFAETGSHEDKLQLLCSGGFSSAGRQSLQKPVRCEQAAGTACRRPLSEPGCATSASRRCGVQISADDDHCEKRGLHHRVKRGCG